MHVAHAWEVLSALQAGRGESPIGDAGELGATTMAMVDADSIRDLGAVAARIERCAAEYLGSPPRTGEDGLRPWLIRGVTAHPTTFSCHMLSESLIHGDDIARSQSMPWPISRAHATLALTGFVLPVFAAIDLRPLVDEEKARRVQGCFDLRVRDGGRVFVVVENGTVSVEAPSPRRVDCHLSGDPAALLLILFSRRSQWPATLRGDLASWGRRPWLGPRLRGVLRNP